MEAFNAYTEIQETTALNVANMVLSGNNLVAVPDDANIVDLQQYQNLKRNFEGHFKTPYFEQFFKFIKKHAVGKNTNNASCFIDHHSINARVIFDFGNVETPCQQLIEASLLLEKTVIFCELERRLNQNLTQRELTEFLEDFGSDIHATDGEGNVINIGIAINAIRTMTISATASKTQETEDFSESSSDYAKIEAKFKDKTPKFLIFTIASHTGLSKREFICRIGVKTGDDKIKLVLRCAKFAEVMEAVNAEFQQIIIDTDVIDPSNVYIGNWSV